jgi:hypothetical protein
MLTMDIQKVQKWSIQKWGDPLLVLRITEEDLEELQKRVLQQKIDELFEEPSTYEDEDDD